MKPFNYGLLCGRFQTFHLGHQSLIDTALKICDNVLILIGSAQESGTKNNPFTYATREKMIKTVYGNDASIIVRPLYDLTALQNENNSPEWGKYLLNQVQEYIYKKPDIMIYGNDKQRSNWFDPEDLEGISEIIINRFGIPISATKARDAMTFNRYEEWMSYTNPKIHFLYNQLRDELLSIDYYHDIRIKNDDNNDEVDYLDEIFKDLRKQRKIKKYILTPVDPTPDEFKIGDENGWWLNGPTCIIGG